MTWAEPQYLWLLAFAPLVAALHWRHRTGLSTGHTVGVIVLRLLVFGLIVGALARPVLERLDETETTVVVVDASASVADEGLSEGRQVWSDQVASSGATAHTRLVTFAESARVAEVDPRQGQAENAAVLERPKDAAGSNIAEALAAAGGLIRHDGYGRIELLTDGRETAGDAGAEARRLAERGIRINLRPMMLAAEGDAVLRSVSLPAMSHVGEQVTITALIEALRAMTGTLIVHKRAEADRGSAATEDVVAQEAVTLSVGENDIALTVETERPGLNVFDVTFEASGDATQTTPETLVAAVFAERPWRVAVVEDDTQRPAAEALSAMLGASAEVRRLSAAGIRTRADLLEIDCLVLADVPADVIAPAAEPVREAVADGLALWVTGGRRTLGPGGWRDLPLADALPVELNRQAERRDPSTTLVVIIDTSGSMGGPRVNLAREIARLAIARLKPHDKVGIVEFYGAKRWAAPIQPASNALDIQRALNRLSAGGGTVILPAIEEAFYALQNVQTRTKHVLVLTDGGVEQGAFEPLIRRMSDRGITLSTVLVGPGTHSSFLASLAHWGRGRFYTAPDRFNLPEIIVKQPDNAQRAQVIEALTALRGADASPVLNGVAIEELPGVGGYVRTQARSTADKLIETESGDPLLTSWQWGLGRVVVWNAHLAGEWTTSLADDDAYGRIWRNLLRATARRGADEALAVRAYQRPGGLEVDVRLLGEGLMGPGVRSTAQAGVLSLTVRRAGAVADVEATDAALQPVEAGHWNWLWSDAPAGAYEVHATFATQAGSLAGQGAAVVQSPREVSRLGLNNTLFAEIAAQQAHAEQRRTAARRLPVYRYVELWPWLVGGAIVSVLLMVLLRRLALRTRMIVRSPATLVAIVAIGVLACGPRAQADGSAASTAAFEEIKRNAEQKTGDLAELIEELAKHAAVGEVGWDQVGDAAWADGRLGVALQAWGKHVENHPNDARAWLTLGRCAEWNGDSKTALDAYAHAIETASDDKAAAFASAVQRRLLAADEETDGAAFDDAAFGATSSNYAAFLAALSGNAAYAAKSLRAEAGAALSPVEGSLMRGLWLLRAERFAEARHAFEQSYALAKLERDRTFALEREIAAARLAGELDAMADEWLAQMRGAGLPPRDKLRALVDVLRELHRSADALTLLSDLRAGFPDDAYLAGDDVQRQIIALAGDEGLEDEIQARYRAMMARQPQRLEWRQSLARVLLLDGRREEAAALFTEAIHNVESNTASPTEAARRLFDIAASTRSLSLIDPALEALRQAEAADPKERVLAVLATADLLRDAGRMDEAQAVLTRLADSEALADRETLVVAEAFERVGDRAAALAMYRRLAETNDSEDVKLRFAHLLEAADQQAEALTVWRRLWETSETPARVRQAAERMLDIAARTGKLADLAIELEEKLAAGECSERELSLLVDIYTTAHDPVSAAEILHLYADHGGNAVETLQRLVQVYLRCELFGRADATLRRLARVDAVNALDYETQRVMVAVERGQVYEARKALRHLAEIAGDDAVVDELSAGVLDLIGLHGEAAQAFGRLLAWRPERVETHLLRGRALAEAGDAARAIGQFAYLVDTAEEDDLFTVGVDGLLNLEAPAAVLRCARRRVFARIAAKPDKVYLYRLAADISEALGQSRQARNILEQAVIVAGERRAPLLRELMEGASADNELDEVVRYGRSLVSLGQVLPPGVYMTLGEALLRREAYRSAEQVFAMADPGSAESVGVDDAIQRRIAEAYARAGLAADAARIIRRLLAAQPNDVPLLLRHGDLLAQQGAFEVAHTDYRRAMELLVGRLPASVVVTEADTEGDARAKQRASRRARNVDESATLFEPVAIALVESARSDGERSELAAWLGRLADDALASAEPHDAASVVAGRPRLEQVAGLVRYVAYAIDAPAIAESFDDRLLAGFADDALAWRAALASRVAWGRYEAAVDLARRTPGDVTLIPVVKTGWLCNDEDRLAQAIDAGEIDASTAQLLVPALIVTGRTDDARKALAVVDTGTLAECEDPQAAAKKLYASAMALDDEAARHKWLEAWLSVAESQSDAEQIVRAWGACVEAVWNHLDEAERSSLRNRLARLAESESAASGAGLGQSVELGMLRLRMESASPAYSAEGVQSLIAELASRGGLDPEDAAMLLGAVAAADRPALLRQLVGGRDAEDVRDFLLGVVAEAEFRMGEALAQVIGEMFAAAPAPRVTASRAYTVLTTRRWFENRRAAKAVQLIGETLLSESPADSMVMAVVAQVRANTGQEGAAGVLAVEALDSLLVVESPTVQHRRLIRDLVRALPPADRQMAIDDLELRMSIEGASAMKLLVLAELRERDGRLHAAGDALIAAYTLEPGNMAVSRPFISVLFDSWRLAELTRLLSEHLRRSTIMESYEWRRLTEAYRALSDPESALAAARRDESPLGPVGVIAAQMALGDEAGALATMRRFVHETRSEGRSFVPFWPDEVNAGGMRGYRTSTEQGDRMDQPRLYEGLAGASFAETEFTAMTRAEKPDGRALPELIKGLAATVRDHAPETWPLGAANVASGEADLYNGLDAKGLGLLLDLAADDAPVPAEVTAALVMNEAVWGRSPQLAVLKKLAAAEEMAGVAERMLRWGVMQRSLDGYDAYRFEERLEWTDAWLSCLNDEEERAEARQLVLRSLEPTPVDEPRDEIEAARMRWMTTAEALDIARAEAARLRVIVGGESGKPEPVETWLPQYLAACARQAASAGDLDAFGVLVRAAVSRNGRCRIAPADEILPDDAGLASGGADARALAEVVIEAYLAANEVLKENPDGWGAGLTTVQGLCLVGAWCVEHGDRPTAESLLDRLEAMLDQPGPESLWVADLARLAGRSDLAERLEAQLREREQLPAARIGD